MIFVKYDWETELDMNKCKEIKSADDMLIINYNTKGMWRLDDIISVINHLYLELTKKSMNKQLYEIFVDIVEKLNNLLFFRVDKTNEEDIIKECLSKFDEFEYKDICNMDLINNIEIIKPMKITMDEINAIKEYDNLWYSDKLGKEDITEKYRNFYVTDINNDNSCYLINCFYHRSDDNRSILSVINSNESIVDELTNVLRKVGCFDRDKYLFENNYLFEFCKSGYHVEIIHLINHLLKTLNYFLNSSSFRDNEFYIYDEIEFKNKLSVYSYFIESAKNIALKQSKY